MMRKLREILDTVQESYDEKTLNALCEEVYKIIRE